VYPLLAVRLQARALEVERASTNEADDL